MRGVCVLTMHVYTKFVESLQQCSTLYTKPQTVGFVLFVGRTHCLKD